MKLSIVAGKYIGKVIKNSDQWLAAPFFAIVFLLEFYDRWGARAIQKVEMLCGLGQIGRRHLFVAISTLVFSVLLFDASNEVFSLKTIQKSLPILLSGPLGQGH